jgi:hypothetical protein
VLRFGRGDKRTRLCLDITHATGMLERCIRGSGFFRFLFCDSLEDVSGAGEVGTKTHLVPRESCHLPPPMKLEFRIDGQFCSCG